MNRRLNPVWGDAGKQLCLGLCGMQALIWGVNEPQNMASSLQSTACNADRWCSGEGHVIKHFFIEFGITFQLSE